MAHQFVWSDEYSVGIDSINDQHQKYFQIANALIAESETTAPRRDNLVALARELVDYSVYHFKTEEDLFAQYGYPDAEKHCKIHNVFREQIGDRLAALTTGTQETAEPAVNLADFATNWLKQHILNVDIQYRDFFQEHGVK